MYVLYVKRERDGSRGDCHRRSLDERRGEEGVRVLARATQPCWRNREVGTGAGNALPNISVFYSSATPREIAEGSSRDSETIWNRSAVLTTRCER